VVQYLKGENLLAIKVTDGDIWITHDGVVQVEVALSHQDQPTRYFPPVNIMNFNPQVSKAAFQQGTQDSTQTREFAFIANPELRMILERDYKEIQRAFIAQCWKSVIILSGGSIEAILMDLLMKNQSAARA
jgi:hypothetical protein